MRQRVIGDVGLPAVHFVEDSSLPDPLPVSLWLLDELSGTTAADLIGDAHGTHYTADGLLSVGETGIDGRAVKYGDSSWVSGTAFTTMGDVHDFERDEAFSVACWLNLASGAGDEFDIIAKVNGSAVGWRLRLVPISGGTSYEAYFRLAGTSEAIVVTLDDAWAPAEWHHLVVTYDGSETAAGVNIYLDGAVGAMTTITDTLATETTINDGDLVVGGLFDSSEMLLDEVAIWESELSAAEVLAHYEGSVWTRKYRAPQGLMTDEGFFALRLTYTPRYASDSLAGDEHVLLDMGPACRVTFDGDLEAFVLTVDGLTVESDAVTFSAGQEITLDLEHTDERRRVRVRGATSGNCRIDDDARPATDIWSQIYLMGPFEGASTWAGDVSAFRPLNAITFDELVDQRLLSQNDEDGVLRTVAKVLARRRGRIHDVALVMRDAHDVDHAVGEALDVIGSIVVLPRHGFSDERYRTFLKIQIELLLSRAREDREWTGTAPNLIRIVRTFVGPDAPAVKYTRYPNKSYTMTVEDLDYAEAFVLQSFLIIATWSEVLGMLQIELGDGDNLWASGSVSVPRGGVWASGSVTVPGAMTWSTALEVM